MAHLIFLLLVAASAYAVNLLVLRSEDVTTSSSWWRQNELTIVLALISIIYPNIFDVSTSTVLYSIYRHLRDKRDYDVGIVSILINNP